MKNIKPEVEHIHTQKEYDINLRKKKFTVYINKHKDEEQRISVYFEGHIITTPSVITDLMKRIQAFKKSLTKNDATQKI